MKFHKISLVKLSPQIFEISIQRCVEEIDPPGSTFSAFLPFRTVCRSFPGPLFFATTMKHQKPKSGVWLHFTEVIEEGAKKAQCNLCPAGPGKSPWQTVPNATRMKLHLSEKHKIRCEPDTASSLAEPRSSSGSSSASSSSFSLPSPEFKESPSPGQNDGQVASQPLRTPASKKQKQEKVSDYLDRNSSTTGIRHTSPMKLQRWP